MVTLATITLGTVTFRETPSCELCGPGTERTNATVVIDGTPMCDECREAELSCV